MSDYAIGYRDRKGRESLLPERYPSLEACHAKIRRLASAWQREASIIQHNRYSESEKTYSLRLGEAVIPPPHP